jgi:hypothetical protein
MNIDQITAELDSLRAETLGDSMLLAEHKYDASILNAVRARVDRRSERRDHLLDALDALARTEGVRLD